MLNERLARGCDRDAKDYIGSPTYFYGGKVAELMELGHRVIFLDF